MQTLLRDSGAPGPDDRSPMTDETERPSWLRETQLRWAWLSWEPLMMFRRVGFQFEAMEANAHWSEDWFRRLHGEEYIRKLADAGFNCVTTHFHKGFGMAAEADEMEMTRRLVELCHHHDIRVFAYVQSMSIMYETFFAEVPEAEEWLQVDKDGRVPTYGDQYWRVFPCLSNDGYVAYVKRVAEKAVNWAHVDGVHLDNTGFIACQCDSCREKFRQYLADRHPDPDRARFGIPNLDHVRVAVVGSTRDPVYQECIRFRCDTLTRFIREMRQYVRGLNPEVAVSANVTISSPLNFYDVYGVDYSNSARAADIVIAENGNFPTVDDGVLITQIPYYKLGHATGAVILPSNWLLAKADECVIRMPAGPNEVKLDMAEAAAYGRQCIGATWAARAIDVGRRTFYERDDIYPAVRAYNSFFKRHESLYVGSRSLANVATFRTFPSLAFHHDEVHDCIAGYEQALIQNQVVFETVFSEDLADLGRLEALVLPNVLCMSDEVVDRIRSFVAAGGGLVATGRTSLFDQNFRQRRDYGLADVFGATYEETRDNDEVFRSGRVVFTPATPEKVSANRFNYQIRAPLAPAHADLVRYVKEVLPGPLPLEVRAGPFVTVEICRAADNVVVHLINHDNARPARDVVVRLSPALEVGSAAELLSPDDGGAGHALKVSRSQDGGAEVRVSQVDTYSMIVFGGA